MAKKSIRLIRLSFFISIIGFCFLLISGCTLPYDGEKLFYTVGCSQCHSFQGKGGRMGPDLSAVSNIRSDDWIDRYIQNPQKINPLARMPSFGHLSRSKRKAIISFLNN